MSVRYVIVGNSAAGTRAAETLRMLDEDSKITIISEENEQPYSRCMLPDYIGGEKDKKGLKFRTSYFYDKYDVEAYLGMRAIEVDTRARIVGLADGSPVPYDKLLIATGASSFIPPIPGIEGNNVFGLRDFIDARHILQGVQESEKALVIGGGFVGLEVAYALNNRGLEVTVVELQPQILPRQFDETAGEILMKDMEQAGIQFILGQGVKSIESPGFLKNLMGNKKKVVTLDEGRHLKTDLIVVAVGTRTNVDFIKHTDIKINKGIQVDKHMETTVPGIYAAGDVVETRDIVTDRIGLTPIWPNASAQGRVAAYNMAGKEKEYGGMIGMKNAVQFREVPAIAMGITRPDEDKYEVLSVAYPEQNYYKKVVLEDNVPVGMILVGDIHQAGIYGALIKKKANIEPYRQKLLRDDFNYANIRS